MAVVLGNVSAPAAWIGSKLFQRLVKVLDRAGVYEGGARCRWEKRGDGGVYVVFEARVDSTGCGDI